VGLLASVVVVNFNGKQFLDACLGALLRQELAAPFEVILVDNGSSDDSVAYVAASYPTVRVIRATRNLGFAGGNNLGMRAATGRHIVLLNNDTQVRPGWLKALVDAAETNPAAGAIASKILFIDPPATIQNAGTLLLSDGSGADRGFREPDQGQYDVREEVFGACGASVLYRREMLDDVGRFDETFFMYYEDTDLSWRMRLRGWSVIYEPSSVVDHVHAGSSREWSPFFTFHVDRNRLFMILKNAPPAMVMRSYSRFAVMAARSALGGVRRRVADRPPAPALSHKGGRARRLGIYLKVVASLTAHLPEMGAKRADIRRRRTAPDAAIERWFIPRERWAVR
jgi:GT2 family glycosyltransferase